MELLLVRFLAASDRNRLFVAPLSCTEYTAMREFANRPVNVRVHPFAVLALAVAVCLGCTPSVLEKPSATQSGTDGTRPALTPVALTPPTDQPEQWSRFRGPTGMGLSTVQSLPLKWNSDLNLAWKIALPGSGASSPIVYGDHIYLTSYSGYFVPGQNDGKIEDLTRHLLAINRADGRLLWDRAIPAKLPEEAQIRDHGFAANTPVADAEGVYLFFGKSGVFAFDHEGNQKWQADVGDKTHGWGTAASPVIWNDLLLVNASVESESLVALDRRSGNKVWQAPKIREAWNTPVVIRAASGREEVVLPTQGTVYAFAPSDGESLWSCKTDIGWYMVPSVVAHDGIVYCFGGRSGIASLAIRSGGSGDVTATHRLWTSLKGANVPSPVYHAGHLFWMHEQRGVAYCAKADSGEVVYEERLERAGQVYASALLAANRIYHLTRDGRCFVLSASPQFEQLAMNDLKDGGIFDGSPVVDGDRLLIRSSKFLYCIAEP
jgi:outer membrane protein assembly factor BamB